VGEVSTPLFYKSWACGNLSESVFVIKKAYKKYHGLKAMPHKKELKNN